MKASVSNEEVSDAQVEFIKIDDGHILVRTTRRGETTEAVISTVPPGKVRPERRSASSPVLTRQTAGIGR